MCFSRAFSSLNWLVSSGFMRMKNALEGIGGRDLNPGHLEYEACVPTNRRLRSVILSLGTYL